MGRRQKMVATRENESEECERWMVLSIPKGQASGDQANNDMIELLSDMLTDFFLSWLFSEGSFLDIGFWINYSLYPLAVFPLER